MDKVGSKQATEPRPQGTIAMISNIRYGLAYIRIICGCLILFRLNSLIVSQMGHMKKLYKDLETLQADTAVKRNLSFLGKVRL